MPIKYQKLKRANMRQLPAGDKLAEHGIVYERCADGDGIFRINVMVDRKRIHRTVGRESEGVTLTQVEQVIEQLRTDARHGRLSLPRGRKTAKAFRTMAADYLDRLEEEGGKDQAAKKRRLEQHLIPFFGDMPLADIHSTEVERYKQHRKTQQAVKSNSRDSGMTYKDAPPSDSTINRELAVLSHLLNKALEWGWIDRLPTRIRRFREPPGRIVYLTEAQVTQLLAAAAVDQNPQIHTFIRIGLDTAMRLSEILATKKEHVDLDRRRIWIPKAKAGRREQPITAGLAVYLRELIPTLDPDKPWLFPSSGKKGAHTTNINKPFRRVVVAAGLDPDQVTRHTLRHTAISHLVQIGVDLPTVARISGHKTLSMVQRYSHANGEHIDSAMAALEARYAREATTADQPTTSDS